MKEVFVHKFASGTVCKLTLTGEPSTMRLDWSQPHSADIRAEYLAWRDRFVAAFAERIGKGILLVIVA